MNLGCASRRKSSRTSFGSWRGSTSEGGTTAVRPFGFFKKGRNSASNNRTGSCIIGPGSVDYESLTIRKNGEIRRQDKRTRTEGSGDALLQAVQTAQHDPVPAIARIAVKLEQAVREKMEQRGSGGGAREGQP